MLYKPVPGNYSYKIALNGKLLNSDGSECTLNHVRNFVYISIYSQEVCVDVHWLALMAHFEVHLPESLLEKFWTVNFVQVTTNSKKKRFYYQMVFKRPMVVEKYYRVIPGFVRYAVDANGKVIDLEEKVTLSVNTPKLKDHYLSVQMYDPVYERKRQIGVHRLVALAWVPNKHPTLRAFVNHKDGRKNNPNWRNLEWVTATENSVHAFKAGLRSDNIPCKVRDIVTKEVTSFSSVSDACDFMGLGGVRIGTLFPIRKGKLIKDRYEIKYEIDTSAWFYEDKEKIVRPGRYTITTQLDEEVQVFYNVLSLIQHYKLWNIPSQGIQCVLSVLKERYPTMEVTVEDAYDTRPIQAFCVTTGEIIEAPTIRAMTQLLQRDKSAIRIGLQAGETRVTDGYAYRRKSDAVWNTQFTKFKCSPRCILATNQSTKETITFKSMRETEAFFKIDRSVVRRCVERDSLCGDWAFKAIEV